MFKARMLGLLAIFIAITTMAGCAGGPLSTRERYTIGGGAVGAASGAIIGSAVGSAAVGAAIGGPVGALGGYLIGDSLQGSGYRTSGGGCPYQTRSRTSDYQVRGYSRKANTHATSSNNSANRSQEPGGSGEIF